MTDTTARDARIAALLRKAADELDPNLTAAPRKARTEAPKGQTAAPKAPKGGFPKGCCQGCGKEGLVSNVLCRKCRLAGTVEVQEGEGTTSRRLNSTPEQAKAGRKVQARVQTEAPASRRGRDASAHCSTDGCSLFVKAGQSVCAKHTEAEAFVTLEDGKRGYRVPAPMVLSLRKAGLSDEEIVAAAKVRGVGRKVTKASTGL